MTALSLAKEPALRKRKKKRTEQERFQEWLERWEKHIKGEK